MKTGKNEVRNKLLTIFRKILYTDVDENTSQKTTNEWDSLNHLLLLTEIEKDFGITIPITDTSRIDTFKKMEDEVLRLI